MSFVDAIGARALEVLRGFGHAAYFFADLVKAIPAAMRRFNLVVTQIHAIGNLSLLIILASGMAVGFVLALQMYYALVTYGAILTVGLMSGAILSHLTILGIDVKGDGGLLFGLALTCFVGSLVILSIRRTAIPVVGRYLGATA